MTNPKRPRIGNVSQPSSISDTTAKQGSNSTTYYGFTSPDKAILTDYSYTAYAAAPGAFKRSLEPTLLTEIVGSSNHELNDDYLSLDKCSNLLQRDPQFHALLLSCWKDGTFQLVRESGELVFSIYPITCLFSSSFRGSKKADIHCSTNNTGSNLASFSRYQTQC